MKNVALLLLGVALNLLVVFRLEGISGEDGILTSLSKVTSGGYASANNDVLRGKSGDRTPEENATGHAHEEDQHEEKKSDVMIQAAARIHDIVRSYQQSPYVKIVWMYWDRGFDHLAYVAQEEKYKADYQCVRAWKIMNPSWHIFILDKEQARKIAPEFARLFSGPDQVQVTAAHAADLLRLELLTRYGGVWSDTSICPFKPADTWIPELLGDNGFFIPRLGGSYAGDTYGDELREKHGNCRFEPTDGMGDADRSGTNHFIVAAHQHHVAIEGWFKAYLANLEEIGRCETTPSISWGWEKKVLSQCVYPYFTAQCSFTMLRIANKTVEEKWQSLGKSLRTGGWAAHAGVTFSDYPSKEDGTDDHEGVCFALSNDAPGNWGTKEVDSKFARKWCYYVKKQVGELQGFVLSGSYLDYVRTTFGSGNIEEN